MSAPDARPFSIRIFVPGGDPDGLRLIERSNWTGLGVVFNRSNYKQVNDRPEFKRTGAYVLVGASEESTLPTIYVGEGDPVRDRLDRHYVQKEFWEWAVFFVSKDESLNKAHAQLMEFRLLQLAARAKQCRLDNANRPGIPTLSEAEVADVESFLVDMLSIFPLLGLKAFESLASGPNSVERFSLESKGINATGYESPRGFVVCRGSGMGRDEAPYIHRYMSVLRRDLLESGIVVPDGASLVFTQDQAFGSPSTAAGVVLGCPMNGRTAWRTEDGRTLKELQAERVGLARE